MIRKLGTETVLMTAGIVLNKAAILAINILLARFSSTGVYGVFALLRNTVNMVETTLSSSINPVVIRMSGKEFGNDAAFAPTNTLLLLVGLGILVAIGIPIWFLAEPISLALFDRSEPRYVHLGVMLLIATNISGIVASLLVSGRATFLLPLASLIAAPVSVAFAFFVMPDYPIVGAMLGLILVNAIEFTIKLVSAIWKKIVSLRTVGRLHQGVLAVLTTSLVILIMSSGLNAFTFWLLRFLLVEVAGGFTPLALFDVSFQYLAVEMMVINNAVTIFQSRAVKASGGDPKEARQIYATGIRLTALITFVACAGNVVFADIMIGLYGNDYDPQMLRVLTLVLPLYAAAVFLNRDFVNMGKPGVLLLVAAVSSVVALLYAIGFMTNAYELAYAFVAYFAVSNLVYLACLAWQRRVPKAST